MGKREIRSVRKSLTDEDRIRHRAIRQQVEEEKEELMARGREVRARQVRLQEAIRELKATRESLGLSLNDVKERTGIEKANLSRLENAVKPNPTIDTLTRYASAVGKELVITLVDKAPSPARTVQRTQLPL